MRIGDYIIYPPFFIAAIVVPIVIAVIIILIINKRLDKKNKELDLITRWQKEHIPKLLENEYNNYPDAKESYKKLLKELQGYIRHHRYWDPDDLIDFNEQAVLVLTTIIFEQIKEDVRKNKKNEAVLLCHTLDFINCGVEYYGKELEWIGDEIVSSKNHEDMSDNEGRLFKILLSNVEKIHAYVDPDLEKIPETIDVDPILKTYVDFDFDVAYDDLQSAIDFRALKDETYDIAARATTELLDDIITELDKNYLPYYQVYYVRALACCLDKQLYDKILTSIEY